MKKIFLILIILVSFSSQSFAYELSSSDKNSLEKAKTMLWELSKTKDKSWFDSRVQKIDSLASKYKSNIRFWMIFNELKTEMLAISDYLSPVDISKYQENIHVDEVDFFNMYWKEITTDLKVPEKCITYYDEIDQIGKELNFPTALIIAMWWKESNCWLYNPANGWWPFQITSSYHNPWDISLDELKTDIIEFINFSKNKWNYFNTNTYVNYKQRFWGENLAITYDNYTLRELQIHSILYNWVSSTTTLTWNSFANNNLNSNVTWASDWVVTRFLKILNWKNLK